MDVVSHRDYGDYQVWWKGNKRHREDGPAVTYPDGGGQWWKDGLMHREDGPAVALNCGYTEWRTQGKLHCLVGPALIHHCGCWHKNGHCVVLDKPLSRNEEWWVHGRQLTEDEFYRFVDLATGEVFIPPGRKLEYDGYFWSGLC